MRRRTPTPEGPHAPAAPVAHGWAAVGAVLAGFAVAAGAFGAHALAPHVGEARMATFETAVRYQTIHALALMIVALLPRPVRAAAPLLLAGSAIFSGSLYLLVATDVGLWGAVAPIGGALMIAGWGVAAWRLARGRASTRDERG